MANLISNIDIALVIIIAIILLIHVLFAVLFANKLQDIADTKAYEGSIWGWTFVLTLFMSVAGMFLSALILIGLPNKNQF